MIGWIDTCMMSAYRVAFIHFFEEMVGTCYPVSGTDMLTLNPHRRQPDTITITEWLALVPPFGLYSVRVDHLFSRACGMLYSVKWYLVDDVPRCHVTQKFDILLSSFSAVDMM